MVKIGKRDKTLSVTFVATHLFSGWRVINYPSRDGTAGQINIRRNANNYDVEISFGRGGGVVDCPAQLNCTWTFICGVP